MRPICNFVITLLLTTSIFNVSGQDIPTPEFTMRPYFIKNGTLNSLERSNQEMTKTKIKAMGYGGYEISTTIPNPTSNIRFKSTDSIAFIVKVDDGIDPTEVFVVQKGIVKSKERQFKDFNGGSILVKSETGVGVSTEFKKLAPNIYLLTFPKQLEAGEYIVRSGTLNNKALSQAGTGVARSSFFGID
jgi:hypothetical protein